MRLKTAALLCETAQKQEGKKCLVPYGAVQPVGGKPHCQGSNPGSPTYTVGNQEQVFNLTHPWINDLYIRNTDKKSMVKIK